MSRPNLRKRKLINYYEPDEPPFDEYVYCEKCFDFVFEYCAIHGPLLIIPDNEVTSKTGVPSWVPRAALTTPKPFLHIAPSIIPGAGLGVFSSLTLPRGVRFGPYRGKITNKIDSMYCWQIRTKNEYTSVDGMDGETSNWMRYVNCARNWREQNLVAFQYQGQIYYRTVKIIPKFTELMVFYGSEFANALGIDLKKYNNSQELVVGNYTIKDYCSNKIITYSKQHSDHQIETLVCEETPKVNHEDILQENIDAEMANREEQAGEIPDTDYHNNASKTNNHTDVSNYINNRSNITVKTNDVYQFYANSSFLRKHEVIHEERKKYTCLDCSYKTHIKSRLNHHMKIHIKYKKYQCHLCTYEGYVKENLQHHIYIVHNKDDPRYNCSQCSYRTNLKSRLTCHMEIHTKDKKYQCHLCSYEGFVKNNLRNHIYSVHNKDDPRYNCSQCSYKTNIKYSFTRHMKIHTKDKKYQCHLCTYEGYVKENLRYHIYSVHNKYGPKYNCGQCSFRTNMKFRLTRHVETHRKDKEYRCDLCPYVGYAKENVKKHIKRVHNKDDPKYNCSQCSYKTNMKYSLTCHMEIHTKDKKYQCHLCTYEGFVKNNLRHHIYSVHNKDGPKYNCGQCSFRTNMKFRLTRHVKTHTKDKEYRCDLCPYVGYAKQNVKMHIKRVHNKDDPKYNCSQCSFETNIKYNLTHHMEIHTKEVYVI